MIILDGGETCSRFRFLRQTHRSWLGIECRWRGRCQHESRRHLQDFRELRCRHDLVECVLIQVDGVLDCPCKDVEADPCILEVADRSFPPSEPGLPSAVPSLELQITPT